MPEEIFYDLQGILNDSLCEEIGVSFMYLNMII